MSDALNFEDKDLLDHCGRIFVHGVVSAMCESVWWAIYLVLFVYATKLQLSRGIRTIPYLIMLTVTLVLFGSSTSLWAMNIAVVVQKMQGILVDYPDLALRERVDKTNERTLQFGLPMEALFLINMLVGDTVVIWRAWALWQDCGRLRGLIAIPIAFLCVSYGFTVNALNCLAQGDFVQSTIPIGGRLCTWSEPISWGVSLFTNLTSTALIAIKAWKVRRFVKTNCGECSKTMTERVLLLLVESGLIYCLFWLSQLILFFDFDPSANRTYAYDIFSSIGEQLSGLYPTIMIILVNKHRSLSCGVNASEYVDSGNQDPADSDELPMIQFRAQRSVVYPQEAMLGMTARERTLSVGTTQSFYSYEGYAV
ncbi:hypothetical protein CYLTODRAFT_490120 [Cylindrobasidium torrendii FP15055 ss-10]|uniref:Family A G protein-coupled receptor-like protein n=1 Tax=Cylindrobasidium torrendii FP15055 ss-10 TaxID=1314674 RepID=A0A0D7BCR7_9AGAR|nr:hypothetical protein CYLTODRAFT_490120 [Cylindrobasidium torrendii FP15055 ss-10]